MTENIWGNSETQYFYALSPDVILNAVESLGFQTTGRCFQHSSMENRVFEIEVETTSEKKSDHFVIAKFYRPGRWTFDQIMEEHAFLFELSENDISVVAPLLFEKKSLFETSGLYFCLFPKQGGRSPEDLSETTFQMLGRLLARMHNVGASKAAQHRMHLNPQTFGRNNLKQLLSSKSIPMEHETTYKTLVESVLKHIEPKFENVKIIRIHGDCHWGNVIYRQDTGMHLIDFDDMVMGPAVQDLWLLSTGFEDEAKFNRDVMIEAYDSMRPFDFNELSLIEPLRTLRYIHFATWISKRWQDPAFPLAFPHFGTSNYWLTQINDLEIQINKF